MQLQEVIAFDKHSYMNTFGDRLPVMFTHGRGMSLYTEEGKEYKDFFAGIAVSALGHAHPILTKALHAQVDKLLHTSSLYYIEAQAKLAKTLPTALWQIKSFSAIPVQRQTRAQLSLPKFTTIKKATAKPILSPPIVPSMDVHLPPFPRPVKKNIKNHMLR